MTSHEALPTTTAPMPTMFPSSTAHLLAAPSVLARPARLIPSWEERQRAGRPVLTESQISELTKRIIAMTSADAVGVDVTHTARIVTRLANGRVMSSDDGDTLEVAIATRYGTAGTVWAHTNQITDETLRAIIKQCDALARDQAAVSSKTVAPPQVPDTYLPVSLWRETIIDAMTTSKLRETTIPTMMNEVTRRELNAAGFIGLMARTRAMLSKDGISGFCEETDAEVTITARTRDGKSSGWAGKAARDWSNIDCAALGTRAAQLALDGRNVQAVEPGRRMAILAPTAVVQIMRYFAQQLDAFTTDQGGTGFSKPGGNRLRQRVFDPRIQLRSDPNDPEGGYSNFMRGGYANVPMTWVENGVLKNLSYDPNYGMSKGKAYTETPYSFRISGGPSSLAEMIASCEEGIYVNRLSDVTQLDLKTGMTTGVTRDGCFLVKNGKIDRPVKNFRFLTSPFFMLNNLVALGATERASFGYTPPAAFEYDEYYVSWPRRPVIVPPMMVRDFNFTSLADAV